MLRAKAKARMKRLAETGVDDETKRALFKNGPETILSIVELKDTLAQVESAKVDAAKFYTVAFSITELSAASTFTVLKHHNLQGFCKGKVVNGLCLECAQPCMGTDVYSFKAILADLSDDSNTLIATCADGAGKSMFGQDAHIFRSLNIEDKKDKIESIMFVPKKAGVWIKYEANKNQSPLVVIFNVRDF